MADFESNESGSEADEERTPLALSIVGLTRKKTVQKNQASSVANKPKSTSQESPKPVTNQRSPSTPKKKTDHALNKPVVTAAQKKVAFAAQTKSTNTQAKNTASTTEKLTLPKQADFVNKVTSSSLAAYKIPRKSQTNYPSLENHAEVSYSTTSNAQNSAPALTEPTSSLSNAQAIDAALENAEEVFSPTTLEINSSTDVASDGVEFPNDTPKIQDKMKDDDVKVTVLKYYMDFLIKNGHCSEQQAKELKKIEINYGSSNPRLNSERTNDIRAELNNFFNNCKIAYKNVYPDSPHAKVEKSKWIKYMFSEESDVVLPLSLFLKYIYSRDPVLFDPTNNHFYVREKFVEGKPKGNLDDAWPIEDITDARLVEVNGVIKEQFKVKWGQPQGRKVDRRKKNYRPCYINGSLISATTLKNKIRKLKPEMINRLPDIKRLYVNGKNTISDK